MNFFLKLLGAKKHNEIRYGRLWEITRLWNRDILEVEVETPKPEPFKKPEGGKADDVRVHMLKPENNVTNLTKDPNLL
ncbi:MAG TPA: hypothetical protein VGZ93_06765 [Candidatus Methylacidiphilales bacterium]|jgi:hypothetical protein|nr:hypothetical protein [Candidatus Methylacidiphilales bacterium]